MTNRREIDRCYRLAAWGIEALQPLSLATDPRANVYRHARDLYRKRRRAWLDGMLDSASYNDSIRAVKSALDDLALDCPAHAARLHTLADRYGSMAAANG